MISGNRRISESGCVLPLVYFFLRPPPAIDPSKFAWPPYPVYTTSVIFLMDSFFIVCLKHFFLFCRMSHTISPFSSYLFSDTVRKSISEASISSPHADPPVPSEPSEFPTRKLSVKSQTCQDLGSHNNSTSHSAPLLSARAVCHA